MFLKSLEVMACLQNLATIQPDECIPMAAGHTEVVCLNMEKQISQDSLLAKQSFLPIEPVNTVDRCVYDGCMRVCVCECVRECVCVVVCVCLCVYGV